MGEGGSGLNSLTLISYYSELVWTMINEGGGGSKENADQIDLILSILVW